MTSILRESESPGDIPLQGSRLSPAVWALVFAIAGTLIVLMAANSAHEAGSDPESYPIFLRLFAFNDRSCAFFTLMALLAAAGVPSLGRWGELLASLLAKRPTFACGLAFLVFAVGARFVYLAHPLSMDEYAPWMQAHAFAHGSLTTHYPPDLIDRIVVRGFQGAFITVNHTTGEVASTYWPGLALLETPFVWLGAPWLLNPLLGALSLWLIQRIAVELTAEPSTGGWAMLFTLASPQFTVMSLSFYAMPALLASTLLYAWLLMRPGLGRAFLAGLVGGLALVLHNPVPHALVAAPYIVWMLARRERWPRAAALLAGYLPLALVLGLGWPLFLSSVRAGEVTHAAHAAASTGFVDEWLGKVAGAFALPGFDLLVAKIQATAKVWLWSMPGLLILFGVSLNRGVSSPVRLLSIGLAVTYVVYWLVPFDQGHGWGYRYLYAAWGILPIAAVQCVRSNPSWKATCGSLAFAGVLVSPVFWWQTHESVADALSYRIPAPGTGHYVIFIAQDTGQYRADLIQNSADSHHILYLMSYGTRSDREFIARQFPGARLVLIDHRGSAWKVAFAKSAGAPNLSGPSTFW